MNKFLKSVFLMLAIVSAQPNQVYSVNWREHAVTLCAMYTHSLMYQSGLEFADSQINNRTLSPSAQRLVVASAALTAGLLIPPVRYLQKEREKLQPKIAYQQQRLAIVEQGRKEDAKRKKELAVLRGKGRIPHFFSDPFGGPVDRVAEMFAPNKQQLFARLDEETSSKNMLLALDKCDQNLKDAQIGFFILYAPIVIPYLVGGGVMCYKKLVPRFTSKQ